MVGTIVGSEISKRYGEKGLPEDTITLRFTGSAGQSFGAFVPKGMSMYLTGDVNDYFGKGLSGGKIIVKAPEESQLVAAENVIAGNVALLVQQAVKHILMVVQGNVLQFETVE